MSVSALFQITTTSSAVIQIEVLDLRVLDVATSSGVCSYQLYVFDGLTHAYWEWCVGVNWVPDQSLVVSTASLGVNGNDTVRTIDVVFVSTSGSAERIAAWLDVQGTTPA